MKADGRIIRGAIAIIILGLLVASYFINPLNNKLNECGFKNLTGHSCPSCGLTRSFFSISHLNFGDAFSFHLLGPVIYIFFLLLAFKFSYEAVSGNRIQISVPSPLLKTFLIVFFGVWLIYWIFKIAGEMGML